MEYKQMHIPINPKRRSGAKATMTSITIHSTANPSSTAVNERNWLVNPSNTRIASWHIAVDERTAVEAIPLNEKAWHAGTSAGNNTSIGIEICESGNRTKTLDNTVRLVAQMLFERNWGVDKVKRHYDWSKKVCPRILSDNNWLGWIKFQNDIQNELNRLRSTGIVKGVEKVDKPVVMPIIKPVTIPVNSNEPSAWAKEDWEWAVLNKLVDGTSPKGNLTREQFVIVLRRFLKMVK